MGADYKSIKNNNVHKYGTDIGRTGRMLFADRYNDRTHFIFELLQNAEDALARRNNWNGPRVVDFILSDSALQVSHFGEPFTEADVHGICGIAESTKGLNNIGGFGIGFKSVYAFTDRPEVHSGDERFAIDHFVWPEPLSSTDQKSEETRFILPFRLNDPSAAGDISKSLQKLGPRTLLFLREIEEVSWSVQGGGPSGFYLRSKPEKIAENARKIKVTGQDNGAKGVIEESWLIFSREVLTTEGKKVGYVEIAFALSAGDDAKILSVQPIDDSVLVVFFPTIVPTNTGCFIQGPYRTTPSRDNVPRDDAWNQYLAKETGTLLQESLCTLRELGLLNADALCALPIDRSKFGEGVLLSPLFTATREALASKDLIPRFGGGHISAKRARLARSKELRELLNPLQLTELFQQDQELGWISEEITPDRTPGLRNYLVQELKVPEIRPEDVVSKFTKAFLERQSDAWLVRLYEFLNGQSALMLFGRLNNLPLIRLEDGSHVNPFENGRPQAFLPGLAQTDFPTVRRSVCGNEGARKFLAAMGLVEPDPVSDVIANVLQRYRSDPPPVSPSEYANDIARIINAFKTDLTSRREALKEELRNCLFVAAIDAATGKRCFSIPRKVYLATERLGSLFEGVPDVLLVDQSHECLHGEGARELLEACGVARYLELIPVDSSLTWDQKRKMRRQARCESYTSEEPIKDFTIRGLDGLLNALPALDVTSSIKKAERLWEALCDLGERRVGAFSGTYKWFFYSPKICLFDAAFVRRLNETPWVPDCKGNLQLPSLSLFEETGWKENHLLLSKILFKRPIIATLAKEAGIESGVIDLLKKRGITSEAQLKALLNITDETAQPSDDSISSQLTAGDAAEVKNESGGSGVPDVDLAGVGADAGLRGDLEGSRERQSDSPSHTGNKTDHSRSPGSTGGRPFVSYVGAHPNEEESDPDGVDHGQRIALEEEAIRLILMREPQLRRTPTNNPGFDLVEIGSDDKIARWIEVKAMTGDLHARPVGLSRTQFESAQKNGARYWLYVVERVSSSEKARIVRIQDPAGKARTFTFDYGWLNAAEIGGGNPTGSIPQEQI